MDIPRMSSALNYLDYFIPQLKKNEFQPNNLPTIISCSYSQGFVGPHTVLPIPAGSPLKK